MPHVEFTYNHSIHRATKFFPFQIVYGFSPLSPLYMISLPLKEQNNFDGSRRLNLLCICIKRLRKIMKQ